MTHWKLLFFSMLRVTVVIVALATHFPDNIANAQDPTTPGAAAASVETAFTQQVQPLLQKFCLRCHNADTMKSGIRLDQLNGAPDDRQLFLWKDILNQIADEAMPPEDELQPTADQRRLLVDWIRSAMAAAQARRTEKHGSIRRLTVSQYRNTLRDLLKLQENLTGVLPPDGVTREGFANTGEELSLSPLQVEAYFDIAEQALDLCIVDETDKPAIQNFRMDLGASINPNPCPDKLILGANSHLLQNEDFVVTELTPSKPFDFEPLRMRTKYEFIEGYQGNATVRGWRRYDSLYHSVFACMRGKEGYPKGKAYQTVPEGLLLRPAVPSAELFGVESTYGPQANFKISLRELPNTGNFRVTVTAARYNDGLLLNPGAEACDGTPEASVTVTELNAPQSVNIPEAGIYRADVDVAAAAAAAAPDGSGPDNTQKPRDLWLTLGDRHFSGTLSQPAFLIVRLPAGPLKVSARFGDHTAPHRIVLTHLNEALPLAEQFRIFEQRSPRIGVHLGLRRDCGSTLNQVGEAQPVAASELQEFVFEGAVNDFPSPDVEPDNVNYLAGIREIGVRSEYTDGRDMPRLLIRSIEFEGPYYETWPPATHRNIFIESTHDNMSAADAREVIRSFATRAFRRPITDAELSPLVAVWETSFAGSHDFRQSVKDALLVILTAPQFLFLIEHSNRPEPEDLDDDELAAKLSYFLWNTAPDETLLSLAAGNSLHQSLDAQVERMILDPRFQQFADEFTSRWLRLDRFDVVQVDSQRFPKLTRDAKKQLRQEPIHFLQHVIQHNLPLRDLIQSDFILANEVVAGYYDLASRTESGFQFVPVKHEHPRLGGVLSQAGILAGLSDGRESNPVKRGAWLARNIIAEPPDDPPPNVPALPEDDDTGLTLRQKLERHRNQEGCANCHSGIDPWGIPFEQFDAGGRFQNVPEVQTRSTLPDETEVANLNELKDYLANDRIDQVAFSILKHLSCYAVGRSLTYNEVVFLQDEGIKLRAADYRMHDLIRFVIHSDLFLKK